MFEARLTQGVLLRKLLDSMKDLVQVMVQANREPDSCDGSLQRFKRDDDWPFLRQPLHVFFSAFADQEYPVFIRLRCFCLLLSRLLPFHGRRYKYYEAGRNVTCEQYLHSSCSARSPSLTNFLPECQRRMPTLTAAALALPCKPWTRPMSLSFICRYIKGYTNISRQNFCHPCKELCPTPAVSTPLSSHGLNPAALGRLRSLSM